MKKIVKGKPSLNLTEREVQGFKYTNDTVAILTLRNNSKKICKIEMEFGDITERPNNVPHYKGYGSDIDINNPKNKDFIDLIRKIYEFHDLSLEDMINEGKLKNICLREILEYVNSLLELELEINIENNKFSYEILNLKESNHLFKENIYKCFFYEIGDIDAMG